MHHKVLPCTRKKRHVVVAELNQVDQRHVESWFEEKNRPELVDDDLPDYDKPVKKHCILGKFLCLHNYNFYLNVPHPHDSRRPWLRQHDCWRRIRNG